MFREETERTEKANLERRRKEREKFLYNQTPEGRRANAIRRFQQGLNAIGNPRMPKSLQKFLNYNDDDDITRKPFWLMTEPNNDPLTSMEIEPIVKEEVQEALSSALSIEDDRTAKCCQSFRIIPIRNDCHMGGKFDGKRSNKE